MQIRHVREANEQTLERIRRSWSAEPPLKRYALRVLWSLPYVLALYVLSTGPMYWACYDAWYVDEGPNFLQVFYYPIVWACQVCEPVNSFFNWYVGLWVYGVW